MANQLAHLRKHNIPVWKQLIASGLFTGLSPVASGTVASAVAVLFYCIPGFANPWVMVAMGLAAFVVGLWIAGPCEEALGDDPSFVTIDEFAGQWITLASPLILGQPNWQWAVICFFTFRAFDIVKLWPASYFDRRRGPLGIMADDLVAGIYANIASHIIWYGLSFAGLVTKFLGEQ